MLTNTVQEQGKRMKEQTEQNQQRSQQLEAGIKEQLETQTSRHFVSASILVST